MSDFMDSAATSWSGARWRGGGGVSATMPYGLRMRTRLSAKTTSPNSTVKTAIAML